MLRLTVVLLLAGAPARAVAAPPVASPAAVLRAAIVPVVDRAASTVAVATAEQRARRAAHARTRELHRLRRSASARAALRRMWLAGAISRGRYEAARRVLFRAARTARRLRGARRAELDAVLRLPADLAARRLLTSARLPLVLLTIRRNARFWAMRPFPAPGERVTFGRDPVVFRFEPGQGLQVHQLSTAGVVNGLARDCLHRHGRCDRARLWWALQRLVDVSTPRAGFTAWESLYRFGGGAPPWISAMTQGTAIQALARGGAVLHERRWTHAARRALGAFERRAPAGVAAPDGEGHLMYSFAPHLRILNGELQALTGLHDVAVLSGSRRARRLFRRDDRYLRSTLPAFDTGAWSRYSRDGAESTLEYHELTAAFLRNLCRRTATNAWCAPARRFTRYVRERPRVVPGRLPRRVRPRRTLSVAFALSKVSDVTVTARGRAGTTVLRRARLARGRHVVAWRPGAPGRHRLRIVAVGLGGPRTAVVRDLVVRRPHRPSRRRDRETRRP